MAEAVRPLSDALRVITAPNGVRRELVLGLRIDAAIEVKYDRHGSILS